MDIIIHTVQLLWRTQTHNPKGIEKKKFKQINL